MAFKTTYSKAEKLYFDEFFNLIEMSTLKVKKFFKQELRLDEKSTGRDPVSGDFYHSGKEPVRLQLAKIDE